MEKYEKLIDFMLQHGRKKSDLSDKDTFKGLNLFEIISGKYHHENLHSDVLRVLLSPNANHKGEDKYLMLFIDFLNRISTQSVQFSGESNFQVVREQGRRDITISTDTQAIVIENKINNAFDTTNQIPFYYKQVRDNGLEVLAIVYLTLDLGKEPDRSTWEVDEKERREIDNRLLSVRVYDGTPNDLISGWLNKCIEVTTDCNTLSVLQQYKSILLKMTQDLMDMEFMSQFKSYLEQGDNYEIAKSMQDNFKELPKYMALTFKDHFSKDNKYKPFNEIRMNGFVPFFNAYRIAEYSFNMDVNIDFDISSVDFSVRVPEDYKKGEPEKVLEAIGMLSDFEWNENAGRYFHYCKSTILENEKSLIDFTEKFLQKLKDNETKIELALTTM